MKLLGGRLPNNQLPFTLDCTLLTHCVGVDEVVLGRMATLGFGPTVTTGGTLGSVAAPEEGRGVPVFLNLLNLLPLDIVVGGTGLYPVLGVGTEQVFAAGMVATTISVLGLLSLLKSNTLLLSLRLGSFGLASMDFGALSALNLLTLVPVVVRL